MEMRWQEFSPRMGKWFHDPGNPWRILRQSSGVLYYEHPAGNIAVSYRAGNADVVSLAVDSLRWIHALFEKKGDVRR